MTFPRQPMCSRQSITRLFALLVLLPGLWLVGGAAASAQATEPLTPEAAIPDLSLLVRTPVGPLEADTRVAVSAALGSVPGTARVTSASVLDADDVGNLAVFYLALDDTVGRTRSIDSVVTDATELLAEELPAARVLVGGPAAADREISESFGGTLRILLLLAVLVGGALGVVFGWQRGAVAATTLCLSVLAAGVLGQRAAGGFDGSMAATVVPGALAGLVLGTAVLVRLLFWFRDPPGADGAEMIRRSILALLPELALILCGFALSAVVVGLMDPGPTPLTAMTMGACIAAVVQLGITAPALALLTEAREARSDLLPFTITDGRDLPLLALSAVAALLLVLTAFGFGRPSATLLGADDLPADSEVVEVGQQLRTGGGDATSAVVATPSSAANQLDLSEWGRTAAELPDVEWVQVGRTKYSAVEAVDVDRAEAPLDPSIPGVAMVVFSDPPRSEAGQAALASVADLPLIGGPPTLAGPAIDAVGASGDRATLLMAVLMLAATGAIAVRVFTQSVGQSIVSFLLRLLGGMAVLGLFGLLGGETPAAVIITGLGAVGLGVGLFELEFLSQFHQRAEFPDEIRANPGQAGALSLAALGLGAVAVGLFSPFWGGPGTGTLGVVVAVAVAVELTVGALLLRPALLGQRAAFHTAVRPVRVALHSGIEREQNYAGVEDPGWRRIIGDLLQAEFRFQSEPGHAALSGVFVPDTPLYRQAAAHHASLAGAGLRIVGRSPRLRSIKTVSGRAPITLAVTVDHPVRHLVDGEGTVVGVRKAERRSGVLWLSESDDGSYRIAESVELGSVALPEIDAVDEDNIDEANINEHNIDKDNTDEDANNRMGNGDHLDNDELGQGEPVLEHTNVQQRGAEPDDVASEGGGRFDGDVADLTDDLGHLYIDGPDLDETAQGHNGTGDSGHSEQERTGS